MGFLSWKAKGNDYWGSQTGCRQRGVAGGGVLGPPACPPPWGRMPEGVCGGPRLRQELGSGGGARVPVPVQISFFGF